MDKITILRTIKRSAGEAPGKARAAGRGCPSASGWLFRTVCFGFVAFVVQVGFGALPSVTPLGAYSEGFRAPSRVACDALGNIFVSDPVAGKIFKIDAFGRISVALSIQKPLALAVDGSGNLLVSQENSGSVSVFDPQGKSIYKLGQGEGEFGLPNFIAAEPNAGSTRVFVSDSGGHQVKVYDCSTFLYALGSYGSDPGQFDFPAGIWVNKSGEIFVVDQGNDRVQVFGASTIRQFPLKASLAPGLAPAGGRSQGVVGDASGRFYIADTFQDIIRVFAADGTFLGALGGIGGAPGQFRSPSGLALDMNGRLLVASANNNRVEILGLDSFLHLSVLPAAPMVPAGNQIRLAARFGGSAPFSFAWRKDGVDLIDGGNISGSHESTLVLDAAALADSGSYSVVVTTSNTVVFSASAEILVSAPPLVRVPPSNQTVAVGSNTLFTVHASGEALSYQWRHDGQPVPGATSSALQLQAAQQSDSGAYSVLISNLVGTASALATLSVLVPPSIVSQPTPGFVVQDEGIIFTVLAEGDALRYQWSFNGQTLPGETGSQLLISNAQPEAAGSYSVQVQNAVGSASSDPAQLVILVPPAQAPQIASFTFSPDAAPELNISAMPGYAFAIEASEDLQSWRTVARFAGSSDSFRFSDREAPNFLQRFYRVRWLPRY